VLAITVGGAGVLTATAVFGGRLVFDHAAGIPTEVLTTEMQNRAEGHAHGPGEGHGDEAHEPASAPVGADSAGTATEPAGHSHPAGTPAHEH
jgi:hypothetical protein